MNSQSIRNAAWSVKMEALAAERTLAVRQARDLLARLDEDPPVIEVTLAKACGALIYHVENLVHLLDRDDKDAST